MHILFVCTGNICRSPMASALLQAKTDKVSVSSAGLFVPISSAASENAVLAMQERGIDIRGHRSRQLTPAILKEADIVLTMTKSHKEIVCAMLPEAAERVYTLGAYVGSDEDVPDPFGGDLSLYRKCAENLSDLIERIPL